MGCPWDRWPALGWPHNWLEPRGRIMGKLVRRTIKKHLLQGQQQVRFSTVDSPVSGILKAVIPCSRVQDLKALWLWLAAEIASLGYTGFQAVRSSREGSSYLLAFCTSETLEQAGEGNHGGAHQWNPNRDHSFHMTAQQQGQIIGLPTLEQAWAEAEALQAAEAEAEAEAGPSALEQALQQTKAELQRIAAAMDLELPSRATKQQIAEAILQRQAEAEQVA
jgi:hypothetical protein